MRVTEMRNNINLFFSGLKNSVERPLSRTAKEPEHDHGRFLRVLLSIEEIRLRFFSFTLHRDELSEEDWAVIQSDLLHFVDGFSASEDVGPFVLKSSFRIGRNFTFNKKKPNQFIDNIIQPNNISIGSALKMFEDYIINGEVDINPAVNDSGFQDLEVIVPHQQISPIHFKIEQNQIRLLRQVSLANEANLSSANSALEYVKKSGERILKIFENSNCDPRLLDTIKDLQLHITQGENVVKIGLSNMACSVMSARFQSELPEAMIAMLYSYTAGVSSYVAQFPEWERFTQNAASIELYEEDVSDLNKVAGDLVQKLAETPRLADSEVPKSIIFAQQILSFPKISSKRAAFAMIRTIENLVSTIIHYSLEFFQKTAEKVIEHGSSATSKIIIGLLSIALIGASGIGAAASRAGAPWVEQAAGIVLKQINKIMN